ncbi:MAG: hypothetical protein V7739_04645 [Motiliproteus sp.]
MDKALEAIQSLPAEYRDKIVVHCIPGDSERLAKALDAALKCYSDLHKRNSEGVTSKHKHVSETLEQIRSGLAAELLRLEGFDLAAAKARGKAEVGKPKGPVRKTGITNG